MKVTVDLGSHEYDILIKPGLLDALPDWLGGYSLAPEKGLMITDDKIDPLYGYATQKRLVASGLKYPRTVIPAGEQSKSHEQLGIIHKDAVEIGLDRKAVILALGGGVVGDLAGYAAATYMRGLRYIQIPTTLLAMVDSAVGGKTGINLPQGKNLVGAFHQPSLVICDLNTLKTLPNRDFRSGLAEVIKYGIIYDSKLFGFCEERLSSILEADDAVLEHVVGRSCQIKADVVQQDEKEGGLRAILNFGHTLGHAIENVSGYGKYMHGEAISIGMVFAARVSAKMKDMPAEDIERIEELFLRAELPVKAPELDWAPLRKAMSIDKKSEAGLPKFVLANKIGSVDFGIAVEERLLEEVWKSM